MNDEPWTCVQCGTRNSPGAGICGHCFAKPGFVAHHVPGTATSRLNGTTFLQTCSRAAPFLYGFALFHAVLSCLVRETGIIMIMVFGFGLPVAGLLAIEWVLPPLLALLYGFQARWSLQKALLGAPLVLVYAVISPTIPAKNNVLPALLPWLAAFPDSTAAALPLVQDRVLWWGSLFVLAMALGHFSQTLHPTSP